MIPIMPFFFFFFFRPSVEVKFAMFKKLCSIMGISPDIKDCGIDSTSCGWKEALPALEQMLRIVHNNDTYVVSNGIKNKSLSIQNEDFNAHCMFLCPE